MDDKGGVRPGKGEEGFEGGEGGSTTCSGVASAFRARLEVGLGAGLGADTNLLRLEPFCNVNFGIGLEKCSYGGYEGCGVVWTRGWGSQAKSQ